MIAGIKLLCLYVLSEVEWWWTKRKIGDPRKRRLL